MSDKTGDVIHVAVITKNRFLYQKIKLELGEAAECILCADGATENFDVYLIDKDCPNFNDKSGLTMSYNDESADIHLPFRIGGLKKLIFGDEKMLLAVDRERKTVHIGGRVISLTEVEFALFDAIYSRGGEYATREDLLDEVWGGACDNGVINVYVHYLREKLETDGEKIILCSRKRGYAISEKYTGGKADA